MANQPKRQTHFDHPAGRVFIEARQPQNRGGLWWVKYILPRSVNGWTECVPPKGRGGWDTHPIAFEVAEREARAALKKRGE